MKRLVACAMFVLLVSALPGGLDALDPPQVNREGAEAPSEAAGFEELGLTVETLVSNLDTPWDLAWGPDGALWFTERPGRVSRVDIRTGELTRIANVEVLEAGESGLMGIAFHPDFQENPFVYLAQSYSGERGIRNRLVRFRLSGDGFAGMEILIDGIPGNTYHDGSRLATGPDGYLYMTTGDAGRKPLAQERDSLAGKILRLQWDGRAAPGNPFGNRVFSYGHRNAQGLVFHPESDLLYITEHGPRDNDEVAIVRKGENHGWPEVRGFCDGDVFGEIDFCEDHEVTEPISAWTPTIAPAGAAFYDSSAIPDWRGSFLFTNLKAGALVRLELSADGSTVRTQHVLAEDAYGRLRDVEVGGDGTLYIATSNRDGRGMPSPQDDRILVVRP
jgi:glucose/arabinose dehydrogenase